MNDLISKLSVIELIDDYNSDALGSVFISYSHGLKFKRAVLKLPSAEKTGKWIPQTGGGYCCSKCGRYALHDVDGKFALLFTKSKYCPNCGSHMENGGKDD